MRGRSTAEIRARGVDAYVDGNWKIVNILAITTSLGGLRLRQCPRFIALRGPSLTSIKFSAFLRGKP
jgi:hypothetical protein